MANGRLERLGLHRMSAKVHDCVLFCFFDKIALFTPQIHRPIAKAIPNSMAMCMSVNLDITKPNISPAANIMLPFMQTSSIYM